jgi:hypothetical protein
MVPSIPARRPELAPPRLRLDRARRRPHARRVQTSLGRLRRQVTRRYPAGCGRARPSSCRETNAVVSGAGTELRRLYDRACSLDANCMTIKSPCESLRPRGRAHQVRAEHTARPAVRLPAECDLWLFRNTDSQSQPGYRVASASSSRARQDDLFMRSRPRPSLTATQCPQCRR